MPQNAIPASRSAPAASKAVGNATQRAVWSSRSRTRNPCARAGSAAATGANSGISPRRWTPTRLPSSRDPRRRRRDSPGHFVLAPGRRLFVPGRVDQAIPNAPRHSERMLERPRTPTARREQCEVVCPNVNDVRPKADPLPHRHLPRVPLPDEVTIAHLHSAFAGGIGPGGDGVWRCCTRASPHQSSFQRRPSRTPSPRSSPWRITMRRRARSVPLRAPAAGTRPRRQARSQPAGRR